MARETLGTGLISGQSPWSSGDQYDEQLHGKPEQAVHAPQRGMAIAVAFAGAAILIALGIGAQVLLR